MSATIAYALPAWAMLALLVIGIVGYVFRGDR